jgi:hypothetical protein
MELEKQLEQAVDLYSESNHAFLYTVFSNDTAVIQVVHSSYIENTRQPNDQFGLSIALSFDPSFTKEITNHERFNALPEAKQFVSNDWEGIPGYACYIGNDTKKGTQILNLLLTKVYGFDEKNSLTIELHDQGPLN